MLDQNCQPIRKENYTASYWLLSFVERELMHCKVFVNDTGKMEILERFTNIIKHKPLLPMPKIKCRNTQINYQIRFQAMHLDFILFRKNYY